jgi:hypothetical protein
MTEPIFEHLEQKARRARRDIAADIAAGMEAGVSRVSQAAEAVFGHGRYHGASVTETLPKERPMGVLAEFDDDLKEYLTDGVTYVEGMAAKLKTAAPGLIAVAQAAGSQTVSGAVEALAGKVLPPDIDAWLAGFIKDAIAKFAAPAQAAQPAAPAGPAQAPAA